MDFYRELNRIYCLNKFDTPEELLTLEPYFYTPSSLPVPSVALVASAVPSHPIITLPIITPPIPTSPIPTCYVKSPPKSTSEWFEPVQSDSLFWCVYTFVNGYSEYLMIGSKYANREIEEKQKFFAFFKFYSQLGNIYFTNLQQNVQLMTQSQ